MYLLMKYLLSVVQLPVVLAAEAEPTTASEQRRDAAVLHIERGMHDSHEGAFHAPPPKKKDASSPRDVTSQNYINL